MLILERRCPLSLKLFALGDAGAHLAEGIERVQTPVLFWYSRNCALEFFNQFRRNALKNQLKKRKNPSKRYTSSILLKLFNATLRSITKPWFSPVRLIYSHSLLHNIISNDKGVNAHFLSH